MVLVLRLLLLAFICFLIYSGLKYYFNPKRKLKLAHEQKQFFLLDEKDVRKNFLITYKGVYFEGEKYVGTAPNTFEVISILIWTNSIHKLHELTREDLSYIEQQVKEKYPVAKIEWKSPIKEELIKKRDL
nr:sigma-w pathway protein ysdB [uncultured Metabacillus sp.]